MVIEHGSQIRMQYSLQLSAGGLQSGARNKYIETLSGLGKGRGVWIQLQLDLGEQRYLISLPLFSAWRQSVLFALQRSRWSACKQGELMLASVLIPFWTRRSPCAEQPKYSQERSSVDSACLQNSLLDKKHCSSAAVLLSPAPFQLSN